MHLMVESYARQLFFCFFFKKKEKVCLARKKAGKLYMWIFFLIARSSTPTAARRHSIEPGFHTTCVMYVFVQNLAYINLLQI